MKFTNIAICVVVLSLLFGCKTTDSNDQLRYYEQGTDEFYISQYDDSLGIFNYIMNEFQRHGIVAKYVYNLSSIPGVETFKSMGSGFFISPSIIVTNAHVLNGESIVKIYQDGEEHLAQMIYTNNDLDIALLRCEETDSPYFRLLSSSDYSIATPVFVLGYPLSDILGAEIRVTSGIVNARSGIDGNTNYIQISAPVQPGNSGGPVLNSDYAVIGMASSKLSDEFSIAKTNNISQNINFAIDSDLISFVATGNIPEIEESNYVDSLEDATSATVRIETMESSERVPGKQYYIDCSYNAGIYGVLNYLTISCRDVSSGLVIASETHYGPTMRSTSSIVNILVDRLLQDVYAGQQ